MMAPHGVANKLEPYNDWPNDIGFETFQEQTTPVSLKVTGKIPAYAAGVLYRAGPGGYQVKTAKGDTFEASHWFDGFSQIHRFVLNPPKDGEYIADITYNSRHTCDELLEDVRKNGKVGRICFGQKYDPCESFFKKVMSTFQAMSGEINKSPSGYNVGVTIKPNMPMPGSSSKQLSDLSSKDKHGVGNLWVKTDNSIMQSIDPTTLEPSTAERHSLLHHSLKGPFAAAHSCTDPVTGDWYNYNLEIGRKSTYRIFRVSASTGQTTILATISHPSIKPAYIHSFLLTTHFVILCIYSAYYTASGLKVLWTKNMLDAMTFDPSRPNLWLVIDRTETNAGLVATFQSPPHFAFHPVNAWDVPSPTVPGTFDIIADVPTYPNLDILKRFYYPNMKSTHPSAHAAAAAAAKDPSTARPTLTRFLLPSINPSTTVPPTHPPQPIQTLQTASPSDSPELPTINPLFTCKPTRYIYGVCDRGHSTFLDGLLKYDSQSNTAKCWLRHAQSPGEPIFVPDPNGGGREDEGVLLSVVLDGKGGGSYLLVLDAKSFEEVGRAELEGGRVVGFGFHGAHVGEVGFKL